MDSYDCVFSVDGKTQLDNRHATGLVAINAVASVAASTTLSKQYVKTLWDAPVPHILVERYYDGLFYLMSFLHCSGNFRIYTPR